MLNSVLQTILFNHPETLSSLFNQSQMSTPHALGIPVKVSSLGLIYVSCIILNNINVSQLRPFGAALRIIVVQVMRFLSCIKSKTRQTLFMYSHLA
uniref:Uncharacterized protein n=1 Tax=Manihot esculenta TaxID=3983 RepID=A0A2C9WIG2_MANES